MKKYPLLIVLSVIVSFAFVSLYASGSSTISTSISTGGNLTVEGNSTFGNASTAVNLFTGTLQASTTALFTSGARMYNTLTLYNSTSAGTALEGGLYYDSSAKVIKLYDGSAWYTVGTSTSGFNLGGTGDRRIQMSDLQDYMTIGTTTQSGLSVLTVEATSTAAIPLTVRGYTSQAANLFQVHDVGGTELLALDKSGNASTTMISTTAGLWVGGNSAVTGTLGVTGVTTLTYATTTSISVTGTASTTNLRVGAYEANTTIAGIVVGTCTVNPQSIAAATSSPVSSSCAATGVRSGDNVFVTPPTTFAGGTQPSEYDNWLQFVGASASSTNGFIEIALFNSSTTAAVDGTSRTWSWMAIR